MKTPKLTLKNAGKQLSREEMKKIMAGTSGGPKCTVSSACDPDYPSCQSGCSCTNIGGDYYCN